MTRVRVLISDMPPMLSEIIQDILDAEHGIEPVPGPAPGEDLEAATNRLSPDVVVIGDADANDPGPEFLYAHPRLRLLTLSRNARIAWVQSLVPERVEIRDISPDALLEAIRPAGPPERPA